MNKLVISLLVAAAAMSLTNCTQYRAEAKAPGAGAVYFTRLEPGFFSVIGDIMRCTPTNDGLNCTPVQVKKDKYPKE
jgi:hypothetical protein